MHKHTWISVVFEKILQLVQLLGNYMARKRGIKWMQIDLLCGTCDYMWKWSQNDNNFASLCTCIWYTVYYISCLLFGKQIFVGGREGEVIIRCLEWVGP